MSTTFRWLRAAGAGFALAGCVLTAARAADCPPGGRGVLVQTDPRQARSTTPAGVYAVRCIDPARYQFNHANLLYTHFGDSRYAVWGPQHDPCRDNIQALFTSYGLPAVQDWFTSPEGPAGCNIVAESTGTTRPQDIYIIGAHYDSFCYLGNPPGADDNASGVAAMLEMARLVAQWGSAATIRFIAFDMEEWGLYGSDAYAGEHIADNILGMLSVDMIAYRWEPHNIVALASRPHSIPLVDAVTDALASYQGLSYEIVDAEVDRSDHAPFEWRGFQAAWVGELGIDEHNPYYHDANDSVDSYAYIDYEYATAVTRGVFAWLVDTAGIRPPGPVGDLDCSYAVDFDDIDAFVLALAGEADYHAHYPDCQWWNADTNGDGAVDFADIDPFIDVLTTLPDGPVVVAALDPPELPEYANFGASVVLDGDTILVGAYGDDDAGTSSGSVYTYERTGDTWAQAGQWLPSGAAATNLFGFSVALDGAVAAVGEPGADSSATDAGAVQMVGRAGGAWTFGTRLIATDAAAGDNFGYSVAVHGDTAVVGAPYDNVSSLADCGSVYVFQRQAENWSQVQKLTQPDKAANDWFGTSVAFDGSTIVVGAPGDDDASSNGGSMSVYELSGGSWTRVAKLLPMNGPPGDQVGLTAALRGTVAVFGGCQSATNAGTAYVFERTGGTWSQIARLAPWWHSGPLAVATDGQRIALGRPAGELPLSAGLAYLFERVGGLWTRVAELAPPNAAVNDASGYAISLDGDLAVFGAPWHDSTVADSGAAYIVSWGVGSPKPVGGSSAQ